MKEDHVDDLAQALQVGAPGSRAHIPLTTMITKCYTLSNSKVEINAGDEYKFTFHEGQDYSGQILTRTLSIGSQRKPTIAGRTRWNRTQVWELAGNHGLIFSARDDGMRYYLKVASQEDVMIGFFSEDILDNRIFAVCE